MPSAFENQSQDSKYHEVCTSWPNIFWVKIMLVKVNEMKTKKKKLYTFVITIENWDDNDEDEEGTGKVGNLIEFEKSCDYEEYELIHHLPPKHPINYRLSDI